MTRVLLVDDDPLVCGALDAMLGSADDIEVVGQAGDGEVFVIELWVIFENVVRLLFLSIQQKNSSSLERSTFLTTGKIHGFALSSR